MTRNVHVSIGDLVFVREDGASVGAVRGVQPHMLIIDIEGLGDVSVPADQVAAVHEGKVVLAYERLHPDVRKAVVHAHDHESNYRG